MESTLALKLSDLLSEVGLFLGYGRGADAGDSEWGTYQAAVIASVVRSGLRQFYFPPPLERGQAPHDWSFLRPVAEVALEAGADAAALPDDFGSPEGQVTVLADPVAGRWPLPLTGEGRVRQRHAEQPAATGRPAMIATRPVKGTGPTSGQRFDLYVWPLADQAYTLLLTYYLTPDALTETRPYAYGGAPHAETILESCLATAEQRLDDSSGVHAMKFMERLAASVHIDRRLKPQLLGYNGDRSDGRHDARGADRRWLYAGDRVTVNGTQY